jgi:gliding motility-associated-like protein
VYPAPSIKITTSSTEVSKGETIQLNTTETAYSYLWTSMEMIDNNTVQDPKAIINNSVWIFLQATDDVTDCPASDSVYIFVRPGSTDSTISPCTGSYIYVPNAFTPNNDNLNDIFKPVANNITLQDFQIYNRWGQMVFETTDIHKGWNGTFQGQLADIGNYVYWLSYFDCTNTTKPKTIKGNIILIR